MLQKLNTKRGGFTLVEIMIVVAIIALLASIAVPNFLRSRRRAQATQVLQDLRMIDAAIDQYAIENNKSSGSAVNWTDIRSYLKSGSRLETSAGTDILGHNFTINVVDRKKDLRVVVRSWVRIMWCACCTLPQHPRRRHHPVLCVFDVGQKRELIDDLLADEKNCVRALAYNRSHNPNSIRLYEV